MSKKAKLSNEQLEEVQRMLIEGKKVKEIATQFNVHVNIIYYRQRKLKQAA